MKRNTTHILVVLLSLPCVSYGLFGELIKHVRPARLVPLLLSRPMATLSDEQRTHYQDLIAKLKSDIKLKKEIISESYCQAPSSFYEWAEQDLRECNQERLIFLEGEKNRIEKILREDR